jgi:hypothetical protein
MKVTTAGVCARQGLFTIGNRSSFTCKSKYYGYRLVGEVLTWEERR